MLLEHFPNLHASLATLTLAFEWGQVFRGLLVELAGVDEHARHPRQVGLRRLDQRVNGHQRGRPVS